VSDFITCKDCEEWVSAWGGHECGAKLGPKEQALAKRERELAQDLEHTRHKLKLAREYNAAQKQKKLTQETAVFRAERLYNALTAAYQHHRETECVGTEGGGSCTCSAYNAVREALKEE
jgi:pyrroloquinoline quinone (PQQ) biosynthesis protein C